MTRPKHKPPHYLTKRKLHAGPFEPPFALDGLAASEWVRVLQVAPWLRDSDAFIVADRCLCFQRLIQAEEDIRLRGHVIRTRNGKVRNPSITIARQYRVALQKYDTQLGLTPAGRDKLRDSIIVAQESTDDALERKLCGPDDWTPPFAKPKPTN